MARKKKVKETDPTKQGRMRQLVETYKMSREGVSA